MNDSLNQLEIMKAVTDCCQTTDCEVCHAVNAGIVVIEDLLAENCNLKQTLQYIEKEGCDFCSGIAATVLGRQ